MTWICQKGPFKEQKRCRRLASPSSKCRTSEKKMAVSGLAFINFYQGCEWFFLEQVPSHKKKVVNLPMQATEVSRGYAGSSTICPPFARSPCNSERISETFSSKALGHQGGDIPWFGFMGDTAIVHGFFFVTNLLGQHLHDHHSCLNCHYLHLVIYVILFLIRILFNKYLYIYMYTYYIIYIYIYYIYTHMYIYICMCIIYIYIYITFTFTGGSLKTYICI